MTNLSVYHCPCGQLRGRVTAHPGKLLPDHLADRWTPEEFANHIKVPVIKINQILSGCCPVTLDLALLFSAALDTTVRYWINLQTSHDLTKIQQKYKTDMKKLKKLNMI